MALRQATLKTAMVQGSGLLPWVRAGLGAIKSKDVDFIDRPERSRVGDSLALDDAMKSEFPQGNRWDYLLSVPAAARIVGMEPHSARDDEIGAVIKKRTNAIDYLRVHLRPGYSVAEWFWVSSGRVGFDDTGRARRRLDQNGITFSGRALRSLG